MLSSENKKEDKANFGRIRNFELLKNGLIKKYVEGGLDLRDRQQKSIFKITDTPKGDNTFASGYFNACTAFGKTYLLIAMAEGYRAEEKAKKIVILEETTDVLEQIAEDFTEKSSFKIEDIGAYYEEEKTPEAPIIICTYTSMKNMVKAVGKENIGLVLCDEAHHGLSPRRQQFIKETFSDACLYGFTGTPEYNAAKTCRDLFETEIDSVDIKEGVSSGLLCSVKNGLMISRIPLDLSKIKDTTGDYNDKKLMDAISKISHKKGIRESLAEYYLNESDEDIGIIRGKTTLINVPNKEEAEKLAQTFNETAGVTIAKAYHEESGKEPLLEFNKGEFPVLIQVRKLSEGYNNPKVELCINYPTASQVREAQCSGRALRKDGDNPNKMALVIDIVFKKENGGDVYEQIAQNGQVLFKDVAEDICFLSPIRQQMHKHRHENQSAKNEIKIDDDMLFDVITTYEDLYSLASAHEEFSKYNNVPLRKDNDISLDEFKSKYIAYRTEKDKLGKEAKRKFFMKLMSDESLRNEGMVARLRDFGGKKRDFIIGDKLMELIRRTGYTIILKSALKYNKKEATDIGAYDFRIKYDVYKADGTMLSTSQKLSLWNKLSRDKKLMELGIVVKKESANGNYFPYIPVEKLKDLQKFAGYDLKEKSDISIFEIKAKNDIGCADFSNKYHVYRADGSELTEVEQGPLFNELINDQKLIDLGIIARKRAEKGRVLPVIVGDRLEELEKYSGYKISATSLINEKNADDISYDDFLMICKLYDKSGKIQGRQVKRELFNDETLNESGIIAVRKDILGRNHKYIIADKLEEFKRQTGYSIKTVKEVYGELETNAAHAKTSAEKHKYLEQARKIFERINLKNKKAKNCSVCLQKIKGGCRE